MEYLLKVSAVIAIFYLCYKLFLQRDTFFEHNRWFLLLGLVTSFLVPLFVIPNYIEYAPTETAIYSYENIPLTSENKQSTNILDYFPFIYGLGVLCFSIRFLIQLGSLSVVIFKNKSVKDGRYTFVKTKKNISPFSFFNWIVYNPTNFTQTDLDQIITHEKAHANQYHSIDILFTQLVNIVLWFNPFIWFYNKDLKQNLEFIADKTAQNNLKCKKSYQTILLKTSIPTHQMALSNNFYNSLIKKRIVMLHKSKSKKINQIKYALVIPLLVLFLMSFNTKDIYIEKEATNFESSIVHDALSENNFDSLLEETRPNIVVDEEKSASKPNKVKPKVNSIIKKNVAKSISKVFQEKTEITIDKNTTDASFNKINTSLKSKGITSKFKSVKRNSQGEIIAIKINVNSETSNANYNISSDDPIKPIIILIDNGGKTISIGNKSINNVVILNESDKTIKLKSAKIDSNNMVIKTNSGKDPIYIVKGKVLSKDEFEEINPKQIKSVTVLKGEKAEAKYGDEGKNGVVIIEKKKNSEIIIDLDNDDDENEKEIIYIKENDNNESKFIIKGTNTNKKDNPLIIIDGKETLDKMKDLDPDDIKEMKVIKGKKAIEKYGEKGENGVIEIITNKK